MNFSTLSYEKQIAFSASCCERLLPNYFAFSLVEDFGNYEFLRRILDEIWLNLLNKGSLQKFDRATIDAIVENSPDTEDFPSLFGSLAGEAVASLCYTLEVGISTDKRADFVTTISDLAKSSVYGYLSAVNDPNPFPHVEDLQFEDIIITLPLYQSEIKKQENDFADLSNSTELKEDIINKLRNTSSRMGIQPFARGLHSSNLNKQSPGGR